MSIIDKISRDSQIDGKLTWGDIQVALFAMVAMSVTLSVAGFAFELLLTLVGVSRGNMSSRGFLIGLALGALLGALLAFLRVSLDLTYRPLPKGVEVEYDYEDLDPVPDIPPTALGVRVYIEDKRVSPSQVRLGHLLPDFERPQAAAILRKIAREVSAGKNFSKRQAARHIPEGHKTEVREEFLRLGLFVRGTSKNVPLEVTELGRGFMDLCLEDPFPGDPLRLYVS